MSDEKREKKGFFSPFTFTLFTPPWVFWWRRRKLLVACVVLAVAITVLLAYCGRPQPDILLTPVATPTWTTAPCCVVPTLEPTVPGTPGTLGGPTPTPIAGGGCGPGAPGCPSSP